MRGKPIAIGDTVLFRLYNTPEHKFYGEVRKATVTLILEVNGEKRYYIDIPTTRQNVAYKMWVHRNEIKGVL
jgi:hypothetical protein